jgi:hypothetical protein
VAVFLVLVARNEFGRHIISDPNDPKALLGKTINLPEFQFPSQRGSIVLALSTTCHFCKESLPFYKTLAAQVQGKADLIAVFPQSDSEAREYLKSASLPVARVVSADLSTIGVHATPTVLLIDRSGKIQGVWNGLLSQKGQDELISHALKGEEVARVF